jgi:quercetin dioxygenase-like cupin family protein
MKERPLVASTETRLLNLTEETQFAPQGIVSRTVLNTGQARVVLFGFSEGQELSEHTSTQHALVQVLTGECEFSLEGTWHTMKPGSWLHMPPGVRHGVRATGAFSMLLTLIKPPSVLGQ